MMAPGITTPAPPRDNGELTTQEHELLDGFRQLNSRGESIVLELVSALVSNPGMRKGANPYALHLLRPRRVAAGLTQQQLADAVGVGRGTIDNWETGGKLRVEYLPRLADALGCTIDGLIGRHARTHGITPVPPRDNGELTEEG